MQLKKKKLSLFPFQSLSHLLFYQLLQQSLEILHCTTCQVFSCIDKLVNWNHFFGFYICYSLLYLSSSLTDNSSLADNKSLSVSSSESLSKIYTNFHANGEIFFSSSTTDVVTGSINGSFAWAHLPHVFFKKIASLDKIHLLVVWLIRWYVPTAC